LPGIKVANCAVLTPGRSNASADTPARVNFDALTPGNDEESGSGVATARPFAAQGLDEVDKGDGEDCGGAGRLLERDCGELGAGGVGTGSTPRDSSIGASTCVTVVELSRCADDVDLSRCAEDEGSCELICAAMLMTEIATLASNS
jgi:hypothetical protein